MKHPLDPELIAFLDDYAAKAAETPEPTVQESRAAYREGYLQRGPQPETDVATRDIPLPTGASMRLYTPPNQSNDALVLYSHGGGFAMGCVETYDNQSRWLAEQTGQRVISLDYRRTPEHIFPAPIEDAEAAFDLIISSGLATPDRLVLAGDSAGGSLCLVGALIAASKGQAPARVVALYPVTDMTVPTQNAPLTGSMKDFAEGYYLEAMEMLWYREQYLPDRSLGKDWRASVVNAPDLSIMPPTTIINARVDPLFDQGRAFAEMLSAAGVKTEHQVHAGVVHNFMEHVSFSPSARKAAACVIKALQL
ncbi:alpha/beta hydrolase [Rhodobacteraceae bacterium D3-12]|nr:alpha/beta hydrolase [Rhodobacteraceae bacterium D3-12]